MPRKSNNTKTQKKGAKKGNGLLDAAQVKIVYIKELKSLDGIDSTHACLLMAQLEYWFAWKNGDSFYKFFAPPEKKNPYYIVGDSWTEELGITYNEVKSAYAQIGVGYTSQKQYEEAKAEGDEFVGKYYCYYTNKMSHVTYFFRNDERVEEAIRVIGTPETETRKREKSKLVDSKNERYGVEEVVISENGSYDLEYTDTTSDTTTDIFKERRQAGSPPDNQLLVGEDFEDEETLGWDTDYLDECGVESPNGNGGEKVRLPKNFEPTLDEKYRAMLRFPNKSANWVTAKFIEYYRTGSSKMSVEAWHLKWWDWMARELTTFAKDSLEDEHFEILKEVLRLTQQASCALSSGLFTVDYIQEYLGDELSEEALTSIFETLYEHDIFGRVGRYYFNYLKAQRIDGFWEEVMDNIKEFDLEDEVIEIHSKPREEQRSCRELAARGRAGVYGTPE